MRSQHCNDAFRAGKILSGESPAALAEDLGFPHGSQQSSAWCMHGTHAYTQTLMNKREKSINVF